MKRKRELRSGEHEISLKAWLLNNTVVGAAADSGVARQSLSLARKEGRKVFLYVKNGHVTYAYELIGEKALWKWS